MPDPHHRRAHLLFAAAAVLVAALNFVRQLPAAHSLDSFAFGDPGWALAVDALLDDGLVPTRDFAFFYGLLGLVVDRAWFAVLGRTAEADTALIAVCNLFIVVGVIRFGRAVELPRVTRWVLLAGIPVAVMPLPYPSPTHAIEAGLLVNALAFHARGRLSVALVLAVVAVFVKPALGYLYAAGLVGLILFAPPRTRWRELLPAALTALALAVFLAVWFGFGPLRDTLLPGAGAKTYADEGFGFFFGTGRRFWLKPSVPYYVFGPVGFWLTATGLMLAGMRGLLANPGRAAGRVVPRTPGLAAGVRQPVASVILACVLLHVVFVAFLFGHELSWLYYSYLPVLGACGVLGRWEAAGRRPKWLPDAVLVVAVCGWVLPVGYGVMIWQGNSRSEATAGLFARGADARGWQEVRELAATRKVLVVTPSGAGRVIFPELDSLRTWVLLEPVATPAEVERVKGQLRAADVIVLHRETASVFESWPELNQELGPFIDGEITPEGASFRVFRRARPPLAASPGPGG